MATCAEDHIIVHVPPTLEYKNGRYIILCGNELLAVFELKFGDKRNDLHTWASSTLTRHMERAARTCQRVPDSTCFGESHPECR